ncbi:MAG: ATP-binding protein involved in chromosome partitioning [Thermococcaceae archaeon]|nr:ATP-binding protein involved in chromosome partitioning [Thermococcaceae archaeon]
MTIKAPTLNIGGLGADPLAQRIEEKQKKWKYKIAVLSGKGGVGKSTVAVNLATALAKKGYFVGILDADIHGPNVQPIIWRGSLVTKAIKQLLGDTKWGELDFMIIDFPPGTGDEILTVTQSISLDAAVIVTTPQEVALLDTGKAVNMMKKMEVPYIAVVENMSYLICPHCGNEIDLFGRGGGRKLAEKEGVEFLGEIPIDLKAREASDAGIPIVLYGDTIAAKAFMELAEKLVKKLEEMKGEKASEEAEE